MFALEINFDDGVSQPEVVLVRRPQVLLGASEEAHVAIDDMANIGYQIQLSKDLGRRFKVSPIGNNTKTALPKQLEGVYTGQANLKVGTIAMHVHCLDTDLALKESEAPDRAGVRVLRQACALPAPEFPALVVRGLESYIMSFSPDQIIYIGRANTCLLRFDSTDVSNKHARIGYESGQFWIEDLGSTNGTFVEGQQISGREEVLPNIPITLGRNISIIGVTRQSELDEATNVRSAAIKRPTAQRYPVLYAIAEIARPARLVLQPGETVSIGRDPSNDMWLGAPHVSRKHCDITLSKSGTIQVTDHSTNGLQLGSGQQINSESFDIGNKPEVLDFGGDLTVAICFDEDQEKRFTVANGDLFAFSDRLSEDENDSVDQSPATLLENTNEPQTMHQETHGTVEFHKLLMNLSLPAKAVLALGFACLIFLSWAVFSLVITMM
jgi:pSer/pThr/pTyr-binding forkhead associated (FHA) protein